MKLCMLDTNMISYLVRGDPRVEAAVRRHSIAACCISAVVEGEIRFGLARHPQATRLNAAIVEVMSRFEVLPWQSSTAKRYGLLRAQLETAGRPLAPLDTLIAAHALEAGAVLVSSDRAFALVEGLMVEDWTG